MPGDNRTDMERIRKRAIADYQKGQMPKEISEHYGLSINTVKSWIKRAGATVRGEGAEGAKEGAKKVHPEGAKRKKGAPPGNTYGVGGKGGTGAPVGNVNAFKHGGYSAIYWDTLTEEEKKLLEGASYDSEQLLLDEIALLSIRERRIMARIERLQELDAKNKSGMGQAVASIMKSEEKREFESADDQALYEERRQERIDKGEIMPGHRFTLTTRTEATYDVIHRLEQALTQCQSQKQRCINSLNELRRVRGDGGKDALQKLDEVLAQIEGVDIAVQ